MATPLKPSSAPASADQLGVGKHPDDHEDEINGAGDGFVVMAGRDGERTGVGAARRGAGGVGAG